jgi:hypothetical protein
VAVAVCVDVPACEFTGAVSPSMTANAAAITIRTGLRTA